MKYIECDALLSYDHKYRYMLRRRWDEDGQRALFVMLNPSTADGSKDDPTIRSCVRLCQDWGHGGFEVVNLFGWRATNPKELTRISDPVGPKNDEIAKAAVNRCDIVIFAWGSNNMAFDQARDHRSLWGEITGAFCMGKTQNGSPKHPLYIKTGTPLVLY